MSDEVLRLLITMHTTTIYCNIFPLLAQCVQVFQMHLYLVVSTSKTLCDCIVNVPNIHFTWAFLNHGLSNQKNNLIQHEKVSNGLTMGQHQRKLHSTYNSYLECQ